MSTAEEIKLTKAQEQAVNEVFGPKFLELAKDESEALSKVLFPDTHTEEITVLGITRKLRPLPLKISKQLHQLLRPISDKISAGLKDPSLVDMTEDLVLSLKEVAVLLSSFYSWTDVQKELPDDGLSLSELQSIAVCQQKINGANDFLLGPLRIVVRVMQLQEVVTLKFHSTFSSRVSPESGSAL